LPQLSALAAFGVWPALPLTGYWLLTRPYRKSGTIAFPLITSIALMGVAGIAVWSVPMLLSAMIGAYRPGFFGLLGWLVTLCAVVRLVKTRDVLSHARLRLTGWDWALVAGLIAAAGLYLAFPHESILGGQDQGVYANHAMYIAHHGRLDVPYPWPESSDDIVFPGFKIYPGFYPTRPNMTARFSHLFPVWLAQAFSTFGDCGLFRLNAMFAILALGIFYGICRLALDKAYAVVATLFLALNPSEMWMARITLTEILTQPFIWSGLLLLLNGLKTDNHILMRWAGVFLGFSALVRIDSLVLVPLLFVAHLAHKIVEDPASKSSSFSWRSFYETALPAFVLAVLYYAFYSAPYFSSLSPYLKTIGITGAIALFAVLAATPGISRVLRRWLTREPVLILLGCALLAVAVYAYWIRPSGMLHSTAHWSGQLLGSTGAYRQDSLVNLARYLSPLVVWMAILGWFVSVWAVVRKRQDLHTIVCLVVIAGFSILYIQSPRVVPYHFWAIRRFVPVVIPGLVLCAAIGMGWGLRRLPTGWTIPTSEFIVVFLAVFTFRADLLILAFAENKGYFVQLKELAQKLPADELILAHGGVEWVTPLYVAFDRKVAHIYLEGSTGQDTLNRWITKQISEQKPAYLLSEGRLRLLGLPKITVDEVVLSRSYSEPTLEPLPQKILSQEKIIRLYKITRISKHSDYRNIALGAEKIWGVEESGFNSHEWHDDRPFRWTNGAAKLVVPVDEQRPPRALRVDIESHPPAGKADETLIRLLANGHDLYHGRIPRGSWSRTFGLDGATLAGQATIELLSDTFVPKNSVPASEDSRTLGILVRGIWLLDGDHPSPGGPLSDKAYRSRLSLTDNGQRLSMAPGQTVAKRVVVRNMGEAPWPVRTDLDQEKGSVRLGILWFDRGKTDRPLVEQRFEFPHAMFNSDEAEIDVTLTATGHKGKPLPPGMYEVWIGLVQEFVTWFKDKGDAVLKLTVEVKS